MKTNNFPNEIYQSCIDFGLLRRDQKFKKRKITEGVSSDIWFVETVNSRFCIKRALSKLTVKEDWFAPVDRSNFEAEYFKACKKVLPNSFPKILGHDHKKYILAMEWFDNKKYKLWKRKLLQESLNKSDAAMVAKVLIKIHSYFYKKRNFEKKFLNDKTFYDIRIEPYILYTSKSYPEYRNKFHMVAKSLVKNKKTLIHGDFSPKNIMIGKSHPIILDAETACWGDPVFDLAFCLNHIILKSIFKDRGRKYLSLGKTFLDNYLKELSFENLNNFLSRFFDILPLFILARVDGKSPVEYFSEKDKKKARFFGVNLLKKKNLDLTKFLSEWSRYIEK